MEKTFQEVISTINDGEIWLNKYKNKRLTKIQKLYNSIIFEFDDEYKDIGVGLNDASIMERKKYELRYRLIGDNINYFNKDFCEWTKLKYPFVNEEIINDWYINN